MTELSSLLRRWRGPPLMLQILALLLGGLVVAQFVTLLLTLLLPPAPSPQHSLAAVAAALRGEADGADRPDRLERIVQAGPPDLRGPGWLISERSRRELAGLLDADADDVRLAFYTPLPFAGTAPSPKLALKANDGFLPPLDGTADLHPASLLVLAQLQVPPGGFGRGADAMQAMRPPPRDSFPPGIRPDDARFGTRDPGQIGTRGFPADGARVQPLYRIEPSPAGGGLYIPGDGGAAVPPLLRGGEHTAPIDSGAATQGETGLGAQALRGQPFFPFIERGGSPSAGPAISLVPAPLLLPRNGAPSSSIFTPLPAPTVPAPREEMRPHPAAPQIALPAEPREPGWTIPYAAPIPPLPAPPTPQSDIHSGGADAGETPIPLAPRAGGLFGTSPAPFVEGDFVAAIRLPNGRWAVVQPAGEGFPNAWQRRVLLWFVIAFAIVAPVGWLFARRVVKPLTGFAEAAERLGRDPSASVLDLDGPAEVGRAARAFNLMQSRVRSFVGDRTAMIGAISHDLRTPLTRLRFRVEEVEDDAVRDGIIGEIEEMETMITSVLAFLRDASAPGVRERLDLRTIVEDVVEDAAMVGGDVRVEIAEAAPVDVDVLGMRRLLANLVENAVKYGDRARVRVSVHAEEAVAEIVDAGPGVPEEDLERAFEPFYRAAEARASDKRGSGLGLAVCRSIARAHGGDVRLVRAPGGFTAQLRVPLAYGEKHTLLV